MENLNENQNNMTSEDKKLSTEKPNKDEFAKNLMESIFGKHLDEDNEDLYKNLMSSNYFNVVSFVVMDSAKTKSESIIKLMFKDGYSEAEVAEKLHLSAEEFFQARYKELKKLRSPSNSRPLREFFKNN